MEKNLGHATAYGYAKSKGYSGTEDEFAQLMADYASVGQSAAQSAEQAAASATSASGSAATATQSAQTATSKASEAVTAANTATTKASEASTSADTASTAAQTATDKASEATTAATTATAKASEASELAATATTAKTDAESARDAAAQSASEAAESARTLTIDATLTKSGQAADAKETGDEIDKLKSGFDNLDDTLMVHKYSENRFNSALVTSETIYDNKQLTGSGVLVDNNKVCVSPFMEIDPNTVYTGGFIPAYGSAKAPWYTLPTAIAFYDDTYTYCGRVDGTNNVVTFTTPNNAKYYRFNILKSSLSLNVVLVRMMLVYGDILPESVSLYTGDTSEPKIQVPVTYAIDSNGIATVTSKYGSGNIVVEFGKRGPNNLPDFRYITANGRQKYNNSTDWFGPFVLEALSNIDGDDPTNSTYTGGNHNYDNTGTMDSSATARNLYLRYYADGKLLANGDSGTCTIFKIVWCNRVQAFNTRKSDGSGREVLEERHWLNFNGYEWETYLEIQALEDLFCRQYYGFQCAITQYPTIYMIGATYRKPFNYTNPHDSGNNTPNIYTGHDSNDRLEMEVDRSVDLGMGVLYGTSGTQGFRTSGSKGYTYFITQKNLAKGDVYGARGWYRFMPQY